MPDSKRITWTGDISLDGAMQGHIGDVHVARIGKAPSHWGREEKYYLQYLSGLMPDDLPFGTIRQAQDAAEDLIEMLLDKMDAAFFPPQEMEVVKLLRAARPEKVATWTDAEFDEFRAKLKERTQRYVPEDEQASGPIAGPETQDAEPQ